MSHSARLPFSQLWAEEEAYISTEAARLSAGAVAVEFGTAQGGSAFLLAKAMQQNNGRVFSYDPKPSREAYEHLAGLPVEIEARFSTEAATHWHLTCGRPVDLLLIDGSHTLANVHADFAAWLPHLRAGSRVLFHDYDRPERGGVPHLGVRVFLDALLEAHGSSRVEHVGRILAITIDTPGRLRVDAADCAKIWRRIGDGVRRVADRSWAGATLLGRDDRALLSIVLDSSFLHRSDVPDATDSGLFLVNKRPLDDNTRALCMSKPERFVLLDDLTLATLLQRALENKRDALLALTRDRPLFFKLEEHLEMLLHACSLPQIDRGELPPQPSIEHLSRACAAEVVRFATLERLRDAIARG